MNPSTNPTPAAALSAGDIEWLESNINAAWELAVRLGGVELPTGKLAYPPSLPAMDRALAAWRRLPESEREPTREVVNAIAYAFGEHLVNLGRLRWGMTPGEHGVELAVHGDGARVLRPARFIAGIVTGIEPGFLVAAADRALAELKVNKA